MKDRVFIKVVTLIILSCSCRSKMISLKSYGLSRDSLNTATNILHKFVDDRMLPGTFARIIKEGKIIYNDKYGFTDVKNKKPVREKSIYRIFSMTKPVTAAAIMTLYDQGKLNLDDEISKYIPEFSKTSVFKKIDGKDSIEPQKNQITIRHLLTHTSGIPYGWQWSYTDSIYNIRQHMKQDWTLEEMINDIAAIPLKFQPGTKYDYGLGIDVAGYIVEVVSGKKLDTYLRSTIFEPLKMDDTDFYVPTEKRERLAKLYTLNENNKIIEIEDPILLGQEKPPKLILGGAGLFSTLDDYEKFCRMILNKGSLDGKRILSEKATEMIITNQLPQGVKPYYGIAHGLSGIVMLDDGEYSWGGAADTDFWINPSKDLIIICFTQLYGFETNYSNEFKKKVEESFLY